MGRAPVARVDVRDMLCAQALALVARAVRQRPIGQATEVLYNAEDVRRDVVTWAADQGHRVRESSTPGGGWSEGAEASLEVTRRSVARNEAA